MNVWQRLAAIVLVILFGLLVFSMVIATMTETGRFHRSIITQHQSK